jgi:hypothetical protein
MVVATIIIRITTSTLKMNPVAAGLRRRSRPSRRDINEKFCHHRLNQPCPVSMKGEKSESRVETCRADKKRIGQINAPIMTFKAAISGRTKRDRIKPARIYWAKSARMSVRQSRETRIIPAVINKPSSADSPVKNCKRAKISGNVGIKLLRSQQDNQNADQSGEQRPAHIMLTF